MGSNISGGLAIGLMSGTSADGCSLALVRFQEKNFRVEGYKTYAYSSELQSKIRSASKMTAPQISSLHFELGNRYANYISDFIRSLKLRPAQISVVGSHGQTVYHGPNDAVPNTLQIGEASAIAEKTGITVVSDFRPRDIAAGGEGAPLVPFFDEYFYGGGPLRALQNIGGISNATLVGKGIKAPIAFDNGPGNCLMDWAAIQATKGRASYDKGGKIAAKGTADLSAIRTMAAHPYFRKAPPKSTGLELFNERFIPASVKKALRKNPESALATLTYFTAYAIADSYKRFILKSRALDEVIVSGGGALNPVLMFHLKNLLYPVRVSTIEKYGLPALAKEPVAFAFFAWRALRGETNHLPSATGAKGARVLGKITPGQNFKRI